MHVWKKEFLSPNARKFMENMCRTMHTQPLFDATPEKYIKEIEGLEISKAIISTNDFAFGSNISILKYNNYVASTVKEHPDLFLGLCGVDPRRKNAIEVFQKSIDAGLCGLKIYPGTGFRPDEDFCMPLYKIAAENDLPVAFHSGYTVSPYSIELGNPLFFEKIIEAFPSLKIISSSQLAYPYMFELSAIMRKCENIYTDYAPMNIDVPEVGVAQNILNIKIMVDERHRIMFATNWPFSAGRVKDWTDLNIKIKLPTLSRLVGIDNVSKVDREYIMGLTACDLFKIKK